MIALRVKITEYNKEKNVCTAQLLNGDKIELDPFVSCALAMTDEEFEAGKGFDVVGKEFILTEYTVYKQNVVPHKNGMIEL